MRKPKTPKKAKDMEIGSRLRTARRARGMTLKHVEATTGIGVSHLSQIENNLRNVNAAKLEALADCYGCAVADFFPRADKPEPEFYRARYLTPTQRKVLKAMEDESLAEHILEQARMRVKYKSAQARRRRRKN